MAVKRGLFESVCFLILGPIGPAGGQSALRPLRVRAPRPSLLPGMDRRHRRRKRDCAPAG